MMVQWHRHLMPIPYRLLRHFSGTWAFIGLREFARERLAARLGGLPSLSFLSHRSSMVTFGMCVPLPVCSIGLLIPAPANVRAPGLSFIARAHGNHAAAAGSPSAPVWRAPGSTAIGHALPPWVSSEMPWSTGLVNAGAVSLRRRRSHLAPYRPPHPGSWCPA